MDRQELDYLSSSEYRVTYPGLCEAMDIPRFTISDLGISPRDATYWDKKGILPKLQTTTTTRRKYTLKQAVWIKLIQQLRSLEVSLNLIKKIKINLLESETPLEELLESEQLLKIVEELLDQHENREDLKRAMQDPEFMKQLLNEKVDHLNLFILYSIIFRIDVNYIITQDGLCYPYVLHKHQYLLDNVEDFDLKLKAPHITLSISQAYAQLVQDWSEKSWFKDLSMISADESKIIKLLRDESTSELRIFKAGKIPDRIIQVQNNKIDAIGQFAEYIARNGYQKITVKTRNGKPVHFQNEVSIKLDNIPE